MLREVVALCLTGCAVSYSLPTAFPISRDHLVSALRQDTVALVTDIGDPFCSGVWVGENRILTAAHCVADMSPGDKVSFAVSNGVEENESGTHIAINPAVLARVDPTHDLALAVALSPGAHPWATLGDDPLVGADVYAMGHPVGLWWSFSAGQVAALRPYVDIEEGLSMWCVQATTPIGPGSSGGGLFNGSGELVGITRGNFARGQNLNLFVAAKDIRLFLQARVS